MKRLVAKSILALTAISLVLLVIQAFKWDSYATEMTLILVGGVSAISFLVVWSIYVLTGDFK